MAEIDIDYELKRVIGILSDVETIELPWSEVELAGFDWFLAVGAVKRLRSNYEKMNDPQKQQYEALRRRITSVKDKLKRLDFNNPFED